MNFKRMIDAETLSLDDIGWSASRDDEQIKKYVKSWFKRNYDREIDDEMVFIIVFMIDDILTDLRKTDKKVVKG